MSMADQEKYVLDWCLKWTLLSRAFLIGFGLSWGRFARCTQESVSACQLRPQECLQTKEYSHVHPPTDQSTH